MAINTYNLITYIGETNTMKKRTYYKVSKVVDFARYQDSIFSSKNLFDTLWLALFGSYNIYQVKSAYVTRRINYSRYIKPSKLTRFTKSIKANLSTLEIAGSLTGFAVLLYFTL